MVSGLCLYYSCRFCTVLNRREVEILQDYIHQVDPKAFLVVSNANEILGEGFKSLKDKVSDD